jgi:hypothetical protein
MPLVEESGEGPAGKASVGGGFLAGRKGRARCETLTTYVFLLPAILVMVIFGLWPMARAPHAGLHK